LAIKRIVVPLDFSGHAMKALRYATAFARQFGATLVFVHVTEPVVYPSDFGYAPLPPNALEENFQRDARERLGALAREQVAAGLKAEVVLRIGKPYYEIVTTAQEQEADLIVITTHGYAGLTHVLLGSTAERVVRHAPCPVLVVREQEHEFIREQAASTPG
jgi:universal stress protein A